MSLVGTERVLVVPTGLFHELGYFQGFSPKAEHYLAELLKPQNISYRPRHEMEQDPDFKQLIPYVIFRHTDGSQPRLFAYTRGTGQGEARLHRKRSIGVGGHISSTDATGQGQPDPYVEGMQRELSEEVDIRTEYTQRCVGLINDDQTPVGQVHLGVVHILDVQQPLVQPREDDIADARFDNVATLWNDWERFESWSQISLQSLFGEGP